MATTDSDDCDCMKTKHVHLLQTQNNTSSTTSPYISKSTTGSITIPPSTSGTFTFPYYEPTEAPKELVIQTKNTPKFTEHFEVFHNNGYLRDLTYASLDGAISKLRKLNYKPNKIITNHDTLMRIQQLVESVISNIKIEDKERTEQLLIATFMAVSVKDGILTRYRGLDIELRDVPVDGIDRIYVCDGDKAGIEIRDLK